MTKTKDSPNYDKPGKHSWKIEGRRSMRNSRRLARVASTQAQKTAADRRAMALGEYLTPKQRVELLRNYKRELAEGSFTKAESKAEPPRAQRRRDLRAYARKVHQPARTVWTTYQALKNGKDLTAAPV